MIAALLQAGPTLAADLALSDGPQHRAKAAEYLSDRAREFLAQRGGRTAKVWVFFTDKGVFDKRGFEAKAAAVGLTERARKRRAKVGLHKILFADLPVTVEYIRDIVDLGALHRRSSRWLNAASFEIPDDKFDDVGALPFVAYLKPVAYFQGFRVAPDSAKDTTPEQLPQSNGLDYGFSLSQLLQINVRAVHEKGYTGEGVTLAITDTGFRKSHDAFALHYAEGRVLAEWDFVQNDGNTANETDDQPDQWDHGTKVWSVAGGSDNGKIYGPAYRANFILCKTEDIASETPVEEDNWVAALEFSDSVGTDVITTSLSYSDWYTYEDMDGKSATITIAANTCDGLGIVMCGAMGNHGSAVGSLCAPADAYDILSVGSVDSEGDIARSSSRGPTYDGRIKPEVCARGVSVLCASSGSDNSYMYGFGTSFATPLIAGAACLLIEVRPEYTPYQVRQALKATADRANSPDNTYGRGIINIDAALGWNGESCCDDVVGNVDCAGLTDVNDLQVLIDHLFLSFGVLCCEEEANVDLRDDIDIGDLQIIIDHFYISLQPLPACP